MATDNQRKPKIDWIPRRSISSSKAVVLGVIFLVLAIMMILSFIMHTIHPQS
jgi:hypothetical protein